MDKAELLRYLEHSDEWDMTGEIYGVTKVVSIAGLNRRGRLQWNTVCVCCGKKTVKVGEHLVSGASASCRRCRGGKRIGQKLKPPSPIEIDGDVARISLVNGETAIIDAKHADAVGKYRWTSQGKSTYMINSVTHMTLGRFIWFLEHGCQCPSGRNVVKLGDDPMDYRASNLIVRTA